MLNQTILSIDTSGRGLIDITAKIDSLLKQTDCITGLCNLFILHTSASIIICENYDPQVKKDLENFIQRLIPDGDPLFLHTEEGPDDMPAHLRTILTQTSLTIPIQNGKLLLGRWQSVYLWEHRTTPFKRNIVITFTN